MPLSDSKSKNFDFSRGVFQGLKNWIICKVFDILRIFLKFHNFQHGTYFKITLKVPRATKVIFFKPPNPIVKEFLTFTIIRWHSGYTGWSKNNQAWNQKF